MKTGTFILLAVITLFTSCTVNKSLFKKVDNQKDFILDRYGSPDEIENVNGNEVWTYKKNRLVKNSRTVIFDQEGRIVSNTKGLSAVGIASRAVVIGYVAAGLGVLFILSSF